jgi:NAD binding domain of 6-phosphogluconate dehydrogenase
MARGGFIGVGNLGNLMARNLNQSGHSLKVYDLSEEVVNFIVQSGAKAASSIKDAAGGVDFVITMRGCECPQGIPGRWHHRCGRSRFGADRLLAQQAAVSAYARPARQSASTKLTPSGAIFACPMGCAP